MLSFAATLSGAVGCNRPEPPPTPYMGPTVSHADLGLGRMECESSGFVIVENGPAESRFPGALAIARLGPPGQASALVGGVAPSGWHLGPIRCEEATYWNSLFNTVADVREVVMLDASSVERPEAGLAEITGAARLAKCSLCLIWGPSRAEPGHAALMGVLMDARHGHQVAFVQADAGPEDFQPPAKDHFKEDRRHVDVNYLAARKFEQQVKDCVFELIARHPGPPSTQPSPWQAAATRPADLPAIPVYVVPNRPASR